MTLVTRLYWAVLRIFGLGERRCGWCKKFQGWKRVFGPPGDKRPTTHGICVTCKAKWDSDLDLQEQRQRAVQLKLERRKHLERRPRRSTLRRRTGGWSGAVAMRGRVA